MIHKKGIFMNKKQLLPLIFSLFLTNIAHSACTPVSNKDDYKLFAGAVWADDVPTVKKLLEKNCYDLATFAKHDIKQHGVFYAKSLDMLKILNKNFDISQTFGPIKYDLLSFYTIQPNMFYSANTENFKEDATYIRGVYKQYNLNIPTTLTDESIISLNNEKAFKNRDEMLDFLFERALNKSELKNLKFDTEGFTVVHYLTAIGDFKHLEIILKNNSKIVNQKNIFKKSNNVNLTPLHLLYSLPIIYQEKEKQEALVVKINDLYLKEIKNSKNLLKETYYNNNNFFQFSEIMKEKNKDFYDKLVKLFPKEQYKPIKPKETKDFYLEHSDILALAKKFAN